MKSCLWIFVSINCLNYKSTVNEFYFHDFSDYFCLSLSYLSWSCLSMSALSLICFSLSCLSLWVVCLWIFCLWIVFLWVTTSMSCLYTIYVVLPIICSKSLFVHVTKFQLSQYKWKTWICVELNPTRNSTFFFFKFVKSFCMHKTKFFSYILSSFIYFNRLEFIIGTPSDHKSKFYKVDSILCGVITMGTINFIITMFNFF